MVNKKALLILILVYLSALPSYALSQASDLTQASGADIVKTLSADPIYSHAVQADRPMLTQFVNDSHLRLAPPDYLQNLAAGPSLNFLFSEPAGVAEGYSIGQHTILVLDLYQQQKNKFGISSIPKPDSVVSWDRLMIYTLAFHDIGKSIAYRGGDKSRETIFSVPLAEDLLRAAGLNRAEVKIGTSLIDAHQLIGRYLQNEMSSAAVTAQIRLYARQAELDPRLFFALLDLVFVADAGSYPALHLLVFRDVNGRLVPRNPAFEALAHTFGLGS